MQKYNKSNNKKQARPWVRELKKFENIHLGKSGMLLIPAPSVLNRWPDSRPTIPEYDNCIKATVNRMIYLNPVIAHDCDYYFFGSWFNRDLEYQAKILKFFETYKGEKFASAYENGWSHTDINRGNCTPEQCDKLGINKFEANLLHWSHDPSTLCVLGHSIVFPAVQILLYMGIKTLYIVGADCGYTLKNQLSFTKNLVNIWKWFAVWFPKIDKYKNISVISINPTSLKGVFHDLYIENNELKEFNNVHSII